MLPKHRIVFPTLFHHASQARVCHPNTVLGGKGVWIVNDFSTITE